MQNKVNQNDFLWYSFFGITQNEAYNNREKALEKCVDRAYLDMCRTISFSKSKNHNKEVENAKNKIIEAINELINRKNSSDFDDWHNETCEIIKDEFNDNDIIDNDYVHYGQAQKWLNMTIKYMCVMDLWERDFNRFSEVLHIPVDTAVLKGAWDYEDVDIPVNQEKLLKNGSRGKYSDDKRIAWSKWEYKEYIGFQETMRKHFNDKLKHEYDSLEIWENKMWMKYAE